jgi:GR25 family glycosyltransferase involved in LPS biosynthesis
MQEQKPKVEILYRYREMQMDEIHSDDIRAATNAMRLYRDSFPVIKHTKCGCWIDLGCGRKKFINLDAHRKWAHPSLEEAMKSFVARKKRQIVLLRLQLLKAEASVYLKAEDAHSLRIGMYHFE